VHPRQSPPDARPFGIGRPTHQPSLKLRELKEKHGVSSALEIDFDLWETVKAMPKAELIIESKPDDNFVNGVCSSCPTTRFRVSGNTLEQKTLVRRMFDAHFRIVHMREDASQAAMRIVREATEGE
jgi:hypothetical protein